MKAIVLDYNVPVKAMTELNETINSLFFVKRNGERVFHSWYFEVDGVLHCHLQFYSGKMLEYAYNETWQQVELTEG